MNTTMAPAKRLRERTAEELRALLARRRMSAAELARRTGIKQSTMARRMTGETAFDLDDLEAIAEVLGVAVSDLLPPREGSQRGRGVDTLQNGRATERHRPSAERRSSHVTATRPAGHADRTRKPDTRRDDTRRPRILPRPGVGAA